MRGLGEGVGLEDHLRVDGDGGTGGGLNLSERGEGLDGEVGALGTRGDEGNRERGSHAGSEGSVESLGNGDLGLDRPGEGLVAGLDSEDGSGSGEDTGVSDELSSTKVGTDTDVLEDGGELDHAGSIGEGEVVLAGLDGRGTSLGNGALEEGGVRELGLANLDEGLDLLVVEANSAESFGA